MKSIRSTSLANYSDDYDLWQAFKAGNGEAFSVMLHQYYPILLKYGMRMFRDKELVRDSVHDLFVELWHHRENLGDVVSIKGYLFQSLRRNIIRESKRLSWFKEAESISDDYDFDVEFNIESELIAQENQLNQIKSLQVHLNQLTKRQREAIFLRYTEELAYEEIGDIMGINYRSAVNLVHEAIKSIRKNWISAFLLLLIIFS